MPLLPNSFTPGTFAWVAPEILVGSKQCSSAVDIYRCSGGVCGWPARSWPRMCSVLLGRLAQLSCCPTCIPTACLSSNMPSTLSHAGLSPHACPFMQPGRGDVGGELLGWAAGVSWQPNRMLRCHRCCALRPQTCSTKRSRCCRCRICRADCPTPRLLSLNFPPFRQTLIHLEHSLSFLLNQIITGERPKRGSLRMPVVPDECPQVSPGQQCPAQSLADLASHIACTVAPCLHAATGGTRLLPVLF